MTRTANPSYHTPYDDVFEGLEAYDPDPIPTCVIAYWSQLHPEDDDKLLFATWRIETPDGDEGFGFTNQFPRNESLLMIW